MEELLKPYTNATESDVSYYSRQLITNNFGIDGQAVIVGAGGLGSAVGLYLGGSGIGCLTIIDFDTISISNLHRQIAHSLHGAEINQNKAESLSDRIKEINPFISINVKKERLTEENAELLLDNNDVIIDCTDNTDVRYIINRESIHLRIPFIYASIKGWEGQLSIFNYNSNACYECIAPKDSTINPDLIPTISPIPGVIGTLEALEAIKLIIRSDELLVDKMLYFNGLTSTFRKIRITKRKDCFCSTYKQKINSETHLDDVQFLDWRDLTNEFILVDLRNKNEKMISGFELSIDFNDEDDIMGLINKWEELNRPNLMLFCRDGRKSRNFYYTLLNNFEKKYLYVIRGGLLEYKLKYNPEFLLI